MKILKQLIFIKHKPLDQIFNILLKNTNPIEEKEKKNKYKKKRLFFSMIF